MQIANFHIQETLHHGRKFFVYRAQKIDRIDFYILKVLEKKAVHHSQTIRALQNEYHFLTQLDSDHIVKAVDWIDDKEYAILVLEDIHGKTLKEKLQKGPLPVKQFLELAMLITKGMAAVHRQNIIHHDLNPHNIIWNSQTGKLQLVDFDIASKFDIKVSYLGNPEKLQGTLLYISPEQTGRMNCRVDQRTDLYSLGVTFYEMLTGKLPFEYRDPMELVYSHLARDPEPPHIVNEYVPELLSTLVSKLLAKNPEDRYQSAEGVKYDLEKLTLSDFENLKGFQLGLKDFSGKLHIPEKLYGREQEIQQLLTTYQRVSQGTKEMLLVTGYSGTGKTALVNQIHTPITKDQGYFISGKFEQLQRSVPYFAFIQAFNRFCQLLLTEKQEVLAQWKANILQAIGELGKVLTDMIPHLESVLGKQPDVPDVGGEEAMKRFHYVFQRFIQAIASKEHPLVVFLDDLQWADLTSLNLLQVLMENQQSHYVLFIGAYRDNEVSPTHPLMTTIKVIQEKQGEIPTIPVKNLTIENIREWLKDTLKTKEEQKIREFAHLIHQKTQGNAFFTIQFLQNLYEQNLLRFDFTRSGWIWDISEIERQNITDNVVELLARKIQTLPAEGQDALKLAACIGNVFELNTLSVISEKAKAESLKDLEIALTEHLIYSIEDETYKFIHDRIHQAAYSLIPDTDTPHLHLKIGRLLLKTFEFLETPEVSEKAEHHIFDIVNHLNIGINLIETEQEKIELVRLNLKAAQQARLSGAYALGSEYVYNVIHLLPGNCWQQYYDLTLAVHNEAIQTSYLCGNFETMEKTVEQVLQFSPNISDKAVAYEYRMMSFIAQNQPHLAEETLLETFNTLGVSLPKTLNPQSMFKARDEEKVKNLPLMHNPQIQLVLRLFANGITGIMHASQELIPFIVSKMIELTLRYGLASETPLVFSLYGVMRNHLGDTSGAYQVGKMCLDILNNVPGGETIKPKVIVNACFYLLAWREHYKNVAKRLRENYQYALSVGDVEYASYSLGNYVSFICRTDTALPALEDLSQTAIETISYLKQPISLYFPSIEAAVVSNLLRQSSNPAFLDIERTDFLQNLQGGLRHLVIYELNIRKIFLAYLFDDNDHILEYIQEAENSWKYLTTPVTFLKTDFHFYIPLAYLRLYTSVATQNDQKEAYLGKIKESLEVMRKWAKFGPINFLHKYYLLQAEWYRVTGKITLATKHYDKAIATAHENEYVNEAAIANELAAKLYLQQNREPLAEFYFQKAWECYREWGATAKVKHLEEHYPKYIHPSTRRPGTTSTDTTGERLDIGSILKASQTLSGEVQLENLLEKMMQILIENAGAQRGVFIEQRDEQLLIQAEGTPNGVSGMLRALPVEEAENLPLAVINYVSRSKQHLVFDNISKDTTYSTDPYIQQHQPTSVVCFPVLKQSELAGMLYLENNLVEGAFTPARLEVLNMLSGQIAISIENAELYENLEEKVQQRTHELQQAHEKLEKSHKDITDNVNYASRIQQAVLPTQDTLAELLPEHFILYQPCAVVSGDFYWIKQLEDTIIVAAVDCTGHGVSGALVSMLGMAFLNEIVPLLAAQSQLTAGNILNELRTRVKIALKQTGKPGEQKEGMDIALCILEPTNNQLHYAGAYNPLYIIRDRQLLEVKADRMPIGIHRKERPFRSHDLPFQRGDMLYLFTDGFVDQAGEQGIGGFSKKRFQQLLLDIHREPVSKQQELLLKRFEAWKGNLPQTDDLLIVGIRL